MIKGGKPSLVVVDVQNDFFPGGALAIPQSDRIIPIVNQLIEWFVAHELPIFFSRVWHPRDHCSFAEFGGMWPVHCVQNTIGATFHPQVKVRDGFTYVSKAMSADVEASSAFDGTELDKMLKKQKTAQVIICGLATEYAIKTTAMDAKNAGFDVFVIDEAIKGVDVHPGDSDRAKMEMHQAGIEFIQFDELNTALAI